MHSKAQRFEHVELKVKDLSKALDFYKNALGLVEIGKENGVTYLGCGYDHNYDTCCNRRRDRRFSFCCKG